MKCESNLKPDAVNNSNSNGSVDSGLAQLNSTHNSRIAKLGLKVFDPEDNMTFARLLFEESGWVPWVCKKLI